LNNAFFNCLGYVASNDRVICEKWIEKYEEGNKLF
jgi:hypothetical protein